MSSLRPRSVRLRVTVLSTVVIGVTLLAASWTLLRIVRADLVDSARTTLGDALEVVAADTSDPEDRAAARFRIDLDGQIAELGVFTRPEDGLASGVLTIDGTPQAQLLLDAESGDVIEIIEPITGTPLEGPFRTEIEALVFEVYDPAEDGTPAALDDPTVLLVGATPLDDVDRSIDAVQRALVVIVPLVIVAVAFASYWLAGRALRPVTGITRRVEEISANELDQRVPVPSSGDEISELATVMNGMLDRLERGAAQTRRFTADASHELRTPLAGVRGAAEILASDLAPDRTTELADGIVADVDRIDAIVDDLLTLARLDEAALLRRDPIDLGHHVRETPRPSSDVRVDVVDEGGALTTGDPSQIDRLVRNLVENAVRHACARVEITTSVEDGAAQLTVADDGDGIAPADRERIFDRFTRLDDARQRNHGGTGLGLAIVRSIADAHGASVEVDDGPLGGARFVVRFPQLR